MKFLLTFLVSRAKIFRSYGVLWDMQTMDKQNKFWGVAQFGRRARLRCRWQMKQPSEGEARSVISTSVSGARHSPFGGEQIN